MGDESVRMISMYHRSADSLGYLLSLADGVIISGGPDVHPELYGRPEEFERCEKVDTGRDALELEMIRYAMENDIPLLGICRGHQMLNVANGGSLIIDIPADFGNAVDHSKGNKHTVRLVEGSLLSEIVGVDSATVNTSHHQAVDRLAPGFMVSAYSSDGLIEAIEPIDRSRHPFILGVQWHPEIMIHEGRSPMTVRIADRFMEEVRKNR
jgi:putative glutamine amidotransferase